MPGNNLNWLESFKIVIENEQEVSLELVTKEDEKIGSAVLKLKQIKSGSSSNKVPISFEGVSIGFFYF